MRLYRIIGAAWAGTQADAKRLATEHKAPWHETEVPTDKPGLLAWLSERNVAARPEEIDQLEAAREPLAWDPMDVREDHTLDAGAYVLGPKTKEPPRVSPAFLGDLAAGAEFVPVGKAAEIDRLLARCPKCHGSATARVVGWVSTASIEDLQTVAEAIKTHVAELGQQLEERSVQ